MRKVNLHEYTDFEAIGKAREFDERVKAENPEFNLAWKRADRAFKNSLILEADEDGISRYEELLGLLSYGSLEERRARVYFEWNRITVWTERTLRAYLNGLVGEKNYKLELIFNKYALKLKLSYGVKGATIDLFENLREIIPANIQRLLTWEINGRLYLAIYKREVKRIKLFYHQPGDIKGVLNSFTAIGYVRKKVKVRYVSM